MADDNLWPACRAAAMPPTLRGGEPHYRRRRPPAQSHIYCETRVLTSPTLCFAVPAGTKPVLVNLLVCAGELAKATESPLPRAGWRGHDPRRDAADYQFLGLPGKANLAAELHGCLSNGRQVVLRLRRELKLIRRQEVGRSGRAGPGSASSRVNPSEFAFEENIPPPPTCRHCTACRESVAAG